MDWGVQAAAALEEFILHEEAEAAAKSLFIISKLLSNAAEHPHDERFRRIKLVNPKP